MHVPDAIGNRVYKMFASPTAAKQEEALREEAAQGAPSAAGRRSSVLSSTILGGS